MHTVGRINLMGVLLLCLLFMYADGNADVLVVPDQYATIQSALDSTQVSDTVLVAPGTYHEFLTGPAHSFTIRGVFPPDSFAPELWTVLDPIPLPDADTPSAFTLLSDSVWIENFVFYNNSEMRQTVWPTRSGGIRNEARMLSISRCRFDSVSAAIDHGGDIRVFDSVFQGNVLHCIWPRPEGRIQLYNCSFSGVGQVLVLGYDSSIVENCTFNFSPQGHFMGLFGSALRVTNCRFDSCSNSFSLFYLWPIQGSVIDRCSFTRIRNVQPILEVNGRCEIDDQAPIVISNCTFEDYYVTPPRSGIVAIQLWCQQGEGNVGEVVNCDFRDGNAPTLPGTGISVSGSATLIDNRFENLTPEDHSDVYVTSIVAVGTTIARNNTFLPPGLAATTDGPPFDARGNWWGDSTGPYNGFGNPEGQGTEVGNGIEFIPWLTSPPDSLPDTTGTGVEERNKFPNDFSLSVFPNPFNPTTTISFSLVESGLVKLELFDLLGRTVATLSDGVLIAGQHKFHFDGSNIASGVYLARLSTPRASQTVKLLLLK